jgi:TonB family protein
MTAAATGWDDAIGRKKTTRAFLLSILLHVLLILLFALVAALPVRTPLPQVPVEETVELTFVEVPRKDATPYLATTEAQRTDSPPPAPAFESDKDTRAASELAPTAAGPLPEQAGEETPGAEFEDRAYTPGPTGQVAGQPSQEATAARPEAAEAAATPLPEAPASEIALLDPARPTPRPREEEAREASESAPPAAPPGYQPQTRVTRLKGGITNRGRSSADAAATPLGRYKKQISDAIGSRWYHYVNEAVGLLRAGTVELRFVVRPDGTVERVEVIRNSSNESFASTSVRAVVDAEIPPIPEELRPSLQESSIEVEFTFSILSR